MNKGPVFPRKQTLCYLYIMCSVIIEFRIRAYIHILSSHSS